jgi:hypothetical protein
VLQVNDDTVSLRKFRELCQHLLDEGTKPTPTELAKRGYGYVRGSLGGAQLKSGRYTKARAEVLQANGWVLDTSRYQHGIWTPPPGWRPKGDR